MFQKFLKSKNIYKPIYWNTKSILSVPLKLCIILYIIYYIFHGMFASCYNTFAVLRCVEGDDVGAAHGNTLVRDNHTNVLRHANTFICHPSTSFIYNSSVIHFDVLTSICVVINDRWHDQYIIWSLLKLPVTWIFMLNCKRSEQMCRAAVFRDKIKYMFLSMHRLQPLKDNESGFFYNNMEHRVLPVSIFSLVRMWYSKWAKYL